MTDAYDDILDEPASERPARGGGSRGGGSRRRDGGSGGASPLQQPGIRAMIALGLLVVVVLILVSSIRGCQRDKLVDSYKSYLTNANAIATESNDMGTSLQTILLNKTFQRRPAIVAQVQDLSNKSAALVQRAKKLSPPDRLKAADQTLITALEYRSLGLSQLPKAIEQAVLAKDTAVARTTLSDPLQVLAASDVIYRTSYVRPVQEALVKDKVKDLTPASSEFFRGNAYDLTTLTGAQQVINNIRQARAPTSADGSTEPGTGKHGVGIATVFAVRSAGRLQLTTGSVTNLRVDPDLTFEVTIENSGDFTENAVDVVVTYIKPNDPTGTEEKQVIPTIDPGPGKEVKLTFKLPGGEEYLQGTSTLKVQAGPVPEEKVTTNNTAQYQLDFNLQ